MPLDFLEDDFIWIASKLSGTTGAQGAEAVDMRNWLLRFRYALEEFRVVVADLADWMVNPPPPPTGYLPCYDGMLPC